MRGGNGPAKDLGMITRSCTHYTHYMPAYFRLLSRYTATTTATFSLKLQFQQQQCHPQPQQQQQFQTAHYLSACFKLKGLFQTYLISNIYNVRCRMYETELKVLK